MSETLRYQWTEENGGCWELMFEGHVGYSEEALSVTLRLKMNEAIEFSSSFNKAILHKLHNVSAGKRQLPLQDTDADQRKVRRGDAHLLHERPTDSVPEAAARV